MMGGEKFDYKFRVTNPTRYELVLSAVASTRLFSLLFNKARGKLKSKGVDVPTGSDPESVDEIEIVPQYLRLIGTFLHKQLKDIDRQVGADKVKILNRRVEKARFRREQSRDWRIEIFITGDCSDER